jgi:hypothetical protein
MADKKISRAQFEAEVKACFDNTVCIARSGQEAYEYGQRMANHVILMSLLLEPLEPEEPVIDKQYVSDFPPTDHM